MQAVESDSRVKRAYLTTWAKHVTSTAPDSERHFHLVMRVFWTTFMAKYPDGQIAELVPLCPEILHRDVPTRVRQNDNRPQPDCAREPRVTGALKFAQVSCGGSKTQPALINGERSMRARMTPLARSVVAACRVACAYPSIVEIDDLTSPGLPRVCGVLRESI